MSLTQDQLAFARQYLNFDAAGFLARRKIKSQLPDFMRRRDKTIDALAVLPPDHPQKDALQQQVDAATQKAQQGDLKGAYRDLEQVKNNAKLAAAATKQGISANLIRAQINPLHAEATRMKNFFDGMKARHTAQADALIDEVKLLTPVSTAQDREAAFSLARYNSGEVGDLQARWAGIENAAQQDIAIWKQMLAAAPNWTLEMDCIEHNIHLLQTETSEQLDGTSQGNLMTVVQRVKDYALTGDGSAQATQIETDLRNKRLEFDAEVKTVTAMPDYDAENSFFTKLDGSPMTPEEQDDAKLELQKQFGALEEKERERLERAQAAYLRAVQQDSVLGATTNHPAPDPVVLGTFDTGEFTDNALNGMDLAQATPDQVRQALSAPMTQHVQQLLQTNPQGDELFDMGARSLGDWQKEVSDSLGYGTDLGALTDPQRAQVEAAAQEMRQIVTQNYPNKVTTVPTGQNDRDGNPILKMDQVTVGGVTYTEVTELGNGGGGTVYKCTNDMGQQIVLKTPLRYTGTDGNYFQDDWDDLSREARSHRTATGGEERECHQNVIDMGGLVLTPNGNPLIAMDLADAGDAEGYTGAMQAAESTGLISPEAAEALNKTAFREMVRGVRAMQMNNMTHHDLKAANVFVMSDGSFKVADFGLARTLDGRDGTVDDLSPEQLSPGMQAPETTGTGDVTQKSDNFTLGAMLENMTNPVRSADLGSDNFYKPAKRGTADENDEKITATSLDRLRNAMLDPDPDKRPSLDAVLFSSYLSDTDENFTDDDIAELRAASAEYSGKVGRALKPLNDQMSLLKAEIQELELSKSGNEGLLAIDYNKRRRADAVDKAQDRRQKLAQMAQDHPDRREIGFQLQDAETAIQECDDTLRDLMANLAAVKTQSEIDGLDDQIRQKRAEMQQITDQIEEINARPDVAPFAARLRRANAPFGARG